MTIQKNTITSNNNVEVEDKKVKFQTTNVEQSPITLDLNEVKNAKNKFIPSNANDSDAIKNKNISTREHGQWREVESFSNLAYAISGVEAKGFKPQDITFEIRNEKDIVKEYIALPIETSNTGIKGYIFVPKDTSKAPLDIIVSWKGTDDTSSLYVDLEDQGAANEAFAKDKNDILKQINDVIGTFKKPVNLTFTGHSLGAACSLQNKIYFDSAVTQSKIEELSKEKSKSLALENQDVKDFQKFLKNNKKYNVPEDSRDNFKYVLKTNTVVFNPPGVSHSNYEMSKLAANASHQLCGPKAKVNYYIAGGDAVQTVDNSPYDNVASDVVEVNVAKTKNKLSHEGNKLGAFSAHTTHPFAFKYEDLDGNIDIHSNKNKEDVEKIKYELNGTKSKLLHPEKIPVIGPLFSPAVFVGRQVKHYGLLNALYLFMSGSKKLDKSKMITPDKVLSALEAHNNVIAKDNDGIQPNVVNNTTVKVDANAEVNRESVLNNNNNGNKLMLSKFDTIKQQSKNFDDVLPKVEQDVDAPKPTKKSIMDLVFGNIDNDLSTKAFAPTYTM